MTGRPLLALLLVAMAWGADAWGVTGHRVVAEIAQMHLTRRAFHELRPLLEMLDNGDELFPFFFPEGYTHVREGGVLSLSDISNAADEFKRYKNDTAKRYRVGPDRLTAYEATAALHFVNRKRGSEELDFAAACTRDSERLCEVQEPEAPYDTWPCCGRCVTSALGFYKEMLFDPSNRERASIALAFLVHLVGDIHQPLHTGFADDRGGNEVMVFNKDTGACEPLHKAWDTTILERFLRQHRLSLFDYAEDLYRSLGGEHVKASKVAFEPRKWALESDHVLIHEHARDADERAAEGAPAPPRGGLHFSNHTGDIYWRLRYEEQAVCPRLAVLAPAIGRAYDEWAMDIINQRLFWAGVRLATLLNENFDGDLFWRLPWPTADIPVRNDHRHKKKKPRRYRHDEL
mmetsp:Transcript_8294/g.34817  ORF Transcript_8294/g.34817 Transcript_8294/m.34817 type:complete len:403 (-) Transcript_8294:35-1243(-)